MAMLDFRTVRYCSLVADKQKECLHKRMQWRGQDFFHWGGRGLHKRHCFSFTLFLKLGMGGGLQKYSSNNFVGLVNLPLVSCIIMEVY